MNKKLQVFVSSTYTDLIEERQAAVQAILDAGHIPAGMELFKAGKSQMETIRKWIDTSDVYMLILGGRYGSIEEESGLSYTELEYKYAISKNMPVFAIVLEDSFLFAKATSMSKDIIFEKDNNDKYETFKSFVMSKIVKLVNNIDSIKTFIHSNINYIQNNEEYNLIGWVRYETKFSQNLKPYLDAIHSDLHQLIFVRNGDMSKINGLINHLDNLSTYYKSNLSECKNCKIELETIFIIFHVIVIKNNEIYHKQKGITNEENRAYFHCLFTFMFDIVTDLLST